MPVINPTPGEVETSTVPSESHPQQLNSTISNSQALSLDDPPGLLTGSPTKLCTYPYKYYEVIEHVKQISQCKCALVDLFPSHADPLYRKNGEQFAGAIAECQHIPTGEQNDAN